MKKLLVAGPTRLSGTVRIHGAKNSVLPILAACCLCTSPCVLHNCPDIEDVRTALAILESLGCKTRREGSTLCIDPTGLDRHCVEPRLAGKMRSSVLFLGALLANFSQAELALPGGCPLGDRPIDLHVKALSQLGVRFCFEEGRMRAVWHKRLDGDIRLPLTSVGATENIMIAASMAQGETVIQNAAREPEILDLAGFLNACGAKVRILPDGTVAIEGVKQLHGCRYRVIPDRIVAVTYLCCCAVAKGELLLRGVRPDHLSAVLPLLEEMGCQLKTEKDTIRIVCRQPLRAVSGISTMPYPGFPTDALAPMMAAVCTAQGTTIFIENIFQDRFKHAWELCRMGADIKAEGRVAVVRGVPCLHCAQVRCTDLRGGAALVVAALGARGKTVVEDIRHLLRGYEHLDRTINSLGGCIVRKTM